MMSEIGKEAVDEAGSSAMATGEEYYNAGGGEWVEKLDTGQLCRICANPNEYLIPIFEGEGLEHELALKIKKHLPIEVSETDTLPRQVCYQCASTVLAWHDLVICCVEADRKLQELQAEENQDNGTAEVFEPESYDSDVAEGTVENKEDISDGKEEIDKTAELLTKRTSHVAKEKKPKQKSLVDSSCLEKSTDFAQAVSQEEKASESAKPNEGTTQDSSERWPAQSVTAFNAFPDKQNLRRAEQTTEHIDVKTEEPPDFAICTFCTIYFASNSELADHLSTYHLQKVMHCNICNEIFSCSKEKFQVHMMQHMSKTVNTDGAQANSTKYYFCKYCNTNFSSRKNLQNHFESHNSDLKGKRIINKVGITTLSGKADLEKQDVKVEENYFPPTYIENTSFSFVDIELVTGRDILQKPENRKQKCSEFECEICGKKYSRKFDMLKHMKLHTEKCDHVDPASDQTKISLGNKIKVEDMDVSNIVEEQAAIPEACAKIGGRRIFYCTLCGKQLTTPYTFKCHLRIHTGEKPFTCHVCGKQFRMRTLLMRHIRDSHERARAKEQDSVSKAQVEVDGRQVYHCSQCGKQLVTRYSYIRHQRIHTGEKPFTCHICGKQFRVQALMRRHIREVHERVRNHPCDICGRCFANSNARNDHRRIHTGERPYVCQLCGKAFKTKASLFIHTKFHQDVFPHPCMLCDKRFRRRQQLSMHLLLHSGEKPHSCTYCGKSFRHNKTLKDHVLIHTNKDTFKCKICDKLFAQERYLKNHIRNHRKQVTSRS